MILVIFFVQIFFYKEYCN